MIYVTRLKNGMAKFHSKPPKDEPYIELEEIPEGLGILYIDEKGNLFYSPTVTLEEPDLNNPVEKLEQENKLLKAQIQAQADRAEFLEDCLAELISVVYS